MTDENLEGGFRQIGNLLPKILPMQNDRVLTPPSGRTSATGTSQTASSLPTSTPLGERGAARLPASEAEWSAMDADEFNAALRALSKSAPVSRHNWLPEKLRPSKPSEIAQEITRCLIATKSREVAGSDRAALIGILSEDLAEFPPDIVITALRKWARRSTWWPSLAEIRDECLWRRETRQSLVGTLRARKSHD